MVAQGRRSDRGAASGHRGAARVPLGAAPKARASAARRSDRRMRAALTSSNGVASAGAGALGAQPDAPRTPEPRASQPGVQDAHLELNVFVRAHLHAQARGTLA